MTFCEIIHYNDVIMSAVVSNHQPHECLLNRLFRRRSKNTSKLRVTGLCEGNPQVTSEFPAQRLVTRKMFRFDGVIIKGKFLFNLIMWISWETLVLLTQEAAQLRQINLVSDASFRNGGKQTVVPTLANMKNSIFLLTPKPRPQVLTLYYPIRPGTLFALFENIHTAQWCYVEW